MQDNSGEGQPRSSLPGFILPTLVAGLALVMGTVMGAVIVYVAKPAEVVEKEVPRDLTAQELEAACAPQVAEVTAKVDQANDKVMGLVSEMREKEARVAELEAEMVRRGKRGAELKAELEAAKAELVQVKKELKDAIDEKERLVVKLKKTEDDLDVSREETRVAKEDSLSRRWEAFVNQSQLDVCERGNRKKMGKCREAVKATLNADRRARFGHCIRSGQEEPSIAEAEKRQESLPQFAEYLDQENKILRDWYILLCDPSLPEATAFASVPSELPEEEPPLPGGLEVPPVPEPEDLDAPQ